MIATRYSLQYKPIKLPTSWQTGEAWKELPGFPSESDFAEPRLSGETTSINIKDPISDEQILTLAYCRLQNRVSNDEKLGPPDEPWLSETDPLRWKDEFCQRRNRRDSSPDGNHRAAL